MKKVLTGFIIITVLLSFLTISAGASNEIVDNVDHAAYILEGAKRLGNVPKIPYIIEIYGETTEEEVPWTIDREYGYSFSESEIEIYKNRLEIILPDK